MELEYYQNIALGELDRNKERNRFYNDVDRAIKGGGELPDSIKDLPWMVHFKSTSLHDAYAAARRTLANAVLGVNILPPAGNAQTAADAEKLEKVLEYNFWLANRRSAKRPMYKIVDNALKYLAVGIQIKDVEHEYKGMSSPRIKAIKSAGRFVWQAHDVRNIHPRFSDDLLEDVLLAQLNSGQELIDMYGEDNDGIKKLIDHVQADEAEKGRDYRKTMFAHYDFTDFENRVVWIVPSDNVDGGGEGFEIMNKEHGLGFLPWVYNYNDDPILKAAIETNQLENLNVLLSMRYALIAATVAQARSWSRTPSGDGVEVDYSNPDAQVQMKSGEDYGVTQPAQLDPNVSAVIASIESGISNTTSVSRILSAMDTIASNTPYSTINAMMQAALSSLIEVKQLCEKSIEDGMYQQLHWIKKTNKPMTGRRLKPKGMYDDMMNVGASISIGSDDFDTDWYVTCTLRPNSPTDRQERMTYAINMSEKLQLPRTWAFDHAGVDIDPEVAFAQWADEQMKIAQVQAESQGLLLQKQMEIQMQAQQAQMQAEAQAQGGQQGGVPTPGGAGPVQAAPGQNREQLTGRTRQGGEVAG